MGFTHVDGARMEKRGLQHGLTAWKLVLAEVAS